MGGLWGSLIPLIIGSALVPVQIIITILLLRSGAGKVTAVAWVAGMTTVRLAQGLLFGLILGPSAIGGSSDGPGTVVSVLLLAVSVLFFVTAGRQLLAHPDEDAPPPRWMAMIDGVTPFRAYLLGVGLLAIGAKFWVFTLGAIAAIGEASLGQTGSTLVFLVFVALAQSINLGILVFAYAAPTRADAALARFSDLLTRYNRVIMITLGLVFGTWFLLKALDGLGIL